jgi:hypothetical protein
MAISATMRREFNVEWRREKPPVHVHVDKWLSDPCSEDGAYALRRKSNRQMLGIQFSNVEETASKPVLRAVPSPADLSAVSTLYSIDTLPVVDESTIHKLRLYTGAALLGAVVCGVSFGWYSHREAVQWIGSGVSVLVYAWVRHRAKP